MIPSNRIGMVWRLFVGLVITSAAWTQTPDTGQRGVTSNPTEMRLASSDSPQSDPAIGRHEDRDLGSAMRFEREVLPLFEENCFRCHGLEGKTKGGLTLNSPAGMLKGGNSGPAINREEPGASLLLEMISYKDLDHEMPPDGKLSPEDIETITGWVRLGAPWPDYTETQAESDTPLLHGMDFSDEALWAFQPLERPPVPEVDDPAWAGNPIDAFIYTRLLEAGLGPAPLASRQTLIRRLFYDFTGLPPTPLEVEAFVNDDHPSAYEHLVDYLLASPRYGEKWGRHWLDLVHYADSSGYERDSDKPSIWRYRDYVIDAFNEDKPYDRFVLEQLAGDEMDSPNTAALIATGYYRLGLWDDEPADELQARYDNLDDVVDTTGKVFLGLTLGCARCHDHKLDPISQSDYYRFLSFFQGVREIKRGKENRQSLLSPFEEQVRQKMLRKKEARQRALKLEIRARLASFKTAALLENPELFGDSDSVRSDLTDLTFRFYRERWNALPDFEQRTPETSGNIEDNYISTDLGTSNEAVGFVFEGNLKVPQAGEYKFFIQSRDGVRLTLDGAIIFSATGLGRRNERVTRNLEEGNFPFRVEYFTKGGPPMLGLAWSGKDMDRKALSVEALEVENTKKLGRLFKKHGEEIMGASDVAELERIEKELKRLEKEKVPGKWVASVAENGAQPPPTHILIRGNPHTPGKAVTPGFPALFRTADPVASSPYADGETSGRRRQLAEWIARPENPLTARVMANRIWQYHFGRGIVRSSNNFGARGRRPTHPDLLDWLAGEFMRGGWRMKPLHKTIVMSRTYRMSSQGRPLALANDPANDLFWRFDMRRLTAEEIRDSILLTSGTLNTKMHGPGIYPKMPAEVMATSSKPSEIWTESNPEEAARRSVYIHVKRSLLLPILTDFDLAETDASCPVRFSTTQPTQALGMLNSAFVNRQANVFAQRVSAEVGSKAPAQVRRALEIATSRPPTEAEVERGLVFIEEICATEAVAPETAFERFCLLTLNLNEFLFLD